MPAAHEITPSESERSRAAAPRGAFAEPHPPLPAQPSPQTRVGRGPRFQSGHRVRSAAERGLEQILSMVAGHARTAGQERRRGGRVGTGVDGANSSVRPRAAAVRRCRSRAGAGVRRQFRAGPRQRSASWVVGRPDRTYSRVGERRVRRTVLAETRPGRGPLRAGVASTRAGPGGHRPSPLGMCPVWWPASGDRARGDLRLDGLGERPGTAGGLPREFDWPRMRPSCEAVAKAHRAPRLHANATGQGARAGHGPGRPARQRRRTARRSIMPTDRPTPRKRPSRFGPVARPTSAARSAGAAPRDREPH